MLMRNDTKFIGISVFIYNWSISKKVIDITAAMIVIGIDVA